MPIHITPADHKGFRIKSGELILKRGPYELRHSATVIGRRNGGCFIAGPVAVVSEVKSDGLHLDYWPMLQADQARQHFEQVAGYVPDSLQAVPGIPI